MIKFSRWFLFINRLAKITWLALSLSFRRKISGPERLRLFFEEAGGAFVKFGQILSLRQDFLPFSYIVELFKLPNKASESPFEKIQAVFAKEKGVPVSAFFSEFNPAPLACSAVSQVYRAKLKNGLPVAVKIQKPGAREIFETDFAVVSFAAGFIDFFRIFSAVNFQEVAADFIGWAGSELDFRLEAKNAFALYEHGLKHPFSVIPKQYPELSTSRVLIQEYIAGGFSTSGVFSGKAAEKFFLKHGIDAAAMSINLAADGMRQYFIDGFFHADPHPANLLFLPPESESEEKTAVSSSARAGRIAYFDFGIVGRADASRMLLLKIMRGIAEKDVGFIASQFMEFGNKLISDELEFYLKMDAKIRMPSEKIFKKIKELMAKDIEKEMAEELNPWFEAVKDPDAPTEKKRAANVLFKIAARAERYGIRLPREEILFLRALSVSDTLALRVSSDFDMIKALNFFFGKYPFEEIESAIEKGTHEEEAGKKIAMPSNADWEVFREISAMEKEKMFGARERIIDLMEYYAERYEEIRSMMKSLR